MQIDGETVVVVNEGDGLLFEDYRRFRADEDQSFTENQTKIVTEENIKGDPMMPILDLLSPYIKQVFFGMSSFDDSWLN